MTYKRHNGNRFDNFSFTLEPAYGRERILTMSFVFRVAELKAMQRFLIKARIEPAAVAFTGTHCAT